MQTVQNQKLSLLIAYDSIHATVQLPSTLQQLKRDLAEQFHVPNKKLLYKENNDVIELENEEDYAYFLSNPFSVKFLVYGDDETSYDNTALALQSNVDAQFELVQSTDGTTAPNPSTPKISNNTSNPGNASPVKPNIDIPCQCLLCYGSKVNKKGNICKRCKGSGTISIQDFNIIKEIVTEETKNCIESMKDEITNSLALPPPSKKEDVALPQNETNPIDQATKCYFCNSPLMNNYFYCNLCEAIFLCEQCEMQKFHPHEMIKIFRHPDYLNKVQTSKGYSLAFQKYECARSTLPEEDFTISYQIVNTGEKFPDHTEFCYVTGSTYFKSYSQKVVPSLSYGMATEIRVQLTAPSMPGSYECDYMIGYSNGKSMQYIGDTAKLLVNVSGELTLLERYANIMHRMGYDKDAALAMLKLYNNNLNLALQYIENANQNKII